MSRLVAHQCAGKKVNYPRLDDILPVPLYCRTENQKESAQIESRDVVNYILANQKLLPQTPLLLTLFRNSFYRQLSHLKRLNLVPPTISVRPLNTTSSLLKMSEITHPTIKDGWFREISDMYVRPAPLPLSPLTCAGGLAKP
jgi:hypothetical protein